MKFLKTDGEHLTFHLGKKEKDLFLDLLKLYPVIPVAHLKAASAEDAAEFEASQKLLEEALAEHREENKRALEVMLAEPHRLRESPSGYRLSLTRFEVDWLLQVLNDIRVGSWIRLGSPDEKHGKQIRLNLKNARYLWAMELCEQFQFALLAGHEAL